MSRAHTYAVTHNVMVPMRDGVRLATDVYRPANADGEIEAGPVPALLVRTSYDKSSGPMVVDPVARFFTRHGYAVVLQDLRGRGGSEGLGQYHHVANPLEGEDGADTIGWIGRQPWSDGKVGMTGSSHLAVVQNCAALQQPRGLKALWVDVAPTDCHDGQSRLGGAMALQMFGALFLHGYDAQELADDAPGRAAMERAATGVRDMLDAMPFRPGATALRLVPNLERVLFHYYHDGVRTPWWAMDALDMRRAVERFADIPVTISSGWYDPFCADAVWQYQALAGRNASPVRLILGPWNHGAMRTGQQVVGEVDFGPASAWGPDVYNRERLAFFDRWLKDRDTGVDRQAPVSYFAMGGGSGRTGVHGPLQHGGTWREAPHWPPGAETTRFFLHADGLLSTQAPGGDGARSWTHDPGDPVPTLGAAVTGFLEWLPMPDGIDPAYLPPRGRMRSIVPDGPLHQRERAGLYPCRPPFRLLSERPDVLVFESEPLDGAIEVTGVAEVELWLASSAPDTDLTVKLLDVYPRTTEYPDGFHMNLVDTIRRGRFRDGFDREVRMQPGAAYRFAFALPPVSNLFAAGHRIRIDIASSNFPRFDVNPGTGEPLGRHTSTLRARNTLFCSATRPSAVLLPVRTAGPPTVAQRT